MVVINGPVARAGSILYRLSIRGTIVPNIAAIMMTHIRAIETVRLNDKEKSNIMLKSKTKIMANTKGMILKDREKPNRYRNVFKRSHY